MRDRTSGKAPARAGRAAWQFAALALAACSGTGWPEPRAEPPPAPGVWRYRVDASAGARELSVHAELPPGVPERLGVDRFAHPFLDAPEVHTDDGWQPLPRAGDGWWAPRCRRRGCALRYRYHLGEAAERIDRFAYAGYRSGVLLAPPSTFLLAPQDYTGEDVYRLSVRTAPGEAFVTGVWPRGGELGAAADVLFEAPYSGFGHFESERLEAAGSTIQLAIAPGDAPLGVSREGLRAALLAAAQAVSAYYGRFPVPAVTLIVLPRAGADIAGMQLGNGGASIVLFLGAEVSDAKLAGDWVLVHELLHLGFPTLDRRHLWLAEGLATYQEPLVRARAGALSEAEVWRGYLTGLREGLPRAGDEGLDGSSRWGRTYWGGALVFLGLDVELRARSAGRQSLDTALQAILRAGGDTSVRWSLQHTLAVGDAALEATAFLERGSGEHGSGERGSGEHGSGERGSGEHGSGEHGSGEHGSGEHGSGEHGSGDHGPDEHGSAGHGSAGHGPDEHGSAGRGAPAAGAAGGGWGAASLATAHARFGRAAVAVDLDALYRRLGVRLEGDSVAFDDAAELAAVRRSLVSPGAEAHD